SNFRRRMACHRRDNSRGIDTAREKRAKRRIAAHTNMHRFIERRFEHPNGVRNAADIWRLAAKRWSEILTRRQFTVCPDRLVAGQKLSNPAEKGRRPRDIAIQEIIAELVPIKTLVQSREA